MPEDNITGTGYEENRAKYWPVRFVGFATIVGLISYLIQTPVSCTRWANRFIIRKTGGFSQDMNVSVDEIKASLTGKAQIRNLKIGNPPVFSVPRITLEFALHKLILGRPFLQTAMADIVNLDFGSWATMDTLLKEKKKTVPFSEFDLLCDKALLNLKSIVAKDTAGRRLLNCEGMQIEFRTDEPEGLRGRLQLQSLNIKHYCNFTQIMADWHYNEMETTLTKLSAGWLGGLLQVNTLLSHGGQRRLQGELVFANLNLDTLSGKKLLPQAVFGGIASGNLRFKGNNWVSTGIKADGQFSIENARMKGFPFQKDRVITLFMPELADLRFHQIKSTHFKIRGNTILLDSLSANGNPLSFSGTGKFTTSGNIFLNLNCLLKKAYYLSLKSYVRDGIPENAEGIPNFKCRIKGNLSVQRIYLDNMVSRIIDVNLKRLGKKLRKLLE